ncbi:MAG: AI-2E family transporter [Acidobacteria bacterium]|nr:AI-2E family transporter [Acidobacteriota bacterium]
MTTGPSRPAVLRPAAQVIALVLAAALALVVLYRIQIVLLAVVLAVFFAYLIAPLVAAVERTVRRPSMSRTTSRGISTGLVYLAMMAAAGAALVLLVPRLSLQASDIAARGPAYVSAVRAWSADWAAWERAKLPPEFQAHVDEAIAAAVAAGVVYGQESLLASLSLVSFVPWLVLIPVLAFFFLRDVDVLRYYAVQALPSAWRGPGYRLVQELNTAIAAYIRAQLLACLIVGVTCGLGFAVLRVPYAALLGAAAGVLEFIPLVGPLVTAVAAGIVAAVQAPLLAVWVVSFLIVLRIVQDYVIYPRLIGHGTHLHPLTIILGVLIGAELGGIVGVFLAVPAMAMLSVGYRHWADWTRVPVTPAGADAETRARAVVPQR